MFCAQDVCRIVYKSFAEKITECLQKVNIKDNKGNKNIFLIPLKIILICNRYKNTKL